MTLGQRIQEYRLGLELSQEALGEKLGVSRQAVSKWEADGAVPDTDKLIALSKLFGITLNELLQVESPAAENGETLPAPEPEQAGEADGKRKAPLTRLILPVLCVAALLLSITALVITFGQKTGELSDRIARLEKQISLLGATSLDLADLVGSWELSPPDSDVQSYSPGVGYTQNVGVTVALSRRDPDEDWEIFFQVYGSDAASTRVEAQTNAGAGGVYSAQVPVASWGGETIAVGFRIDGVEYLQPLAVIDELSAHLIRYTPLLEQP